MVLLHVLVPAEVRRNVVLDEDRFEVVAPPRDSTLTLVPLGSAGGIFRLPQTVCYGPVRDTLGR